MNADTTEEQRRRNTEQRRAFIKRWTEYIRNHSDEEWSRQQNKLINSQLKSANELAQAGKTDPVEFIKRRDNIARSSTLENEGSLDYDL
jgi:hypothetical protein